MLYATYYLPLIERVRAIPGVQVAALSSVLPLRAKMSVSHLRDARPQGCAQGKYALRDGPTRLGWAG